VRAATSWFRGRFQESLRVCLERLEPQARQCVVLAYCFGLSREELAERFGRPVNTIKTVLHRSLKALLGCMDAE
jgi:RNA polymerase sigma factor (sigma-70 family)